MFRDFTVTDLDYFDSESSSLMSSGSFIDNICLLNLDFPKDFGSFSCDLSEMG